jgi:niacin transporter
MKTWNPSKMTAAALLIAVGICIPLFMPVKFVMEPVSYTLASHVAIFIAMMIDPAIAAVVTVGTFLGFFTTFPLVIALRAASHIVFAMTGAIYLKYHRGTLSSMASTQVFAFCIALIHAVCEVLVVCWFYFGGYMDSYYEYGFVNTVVILIGAGSVVHSMIDFEISYVVYKALCKQKGFVAMLADR